MALHQRRLCDRVGAANNLSRQHQNSRRSWRLPAPFVTRIPTVDVKTGRWEGREMIMRRKGASTAVVCCWADRLCNTAVRSGSFRVSSCGTNTFPNQGIREDQREDHGGING
nr:hypothetical protein CFP56_34777 [Quercus suber]